MLETILNSGALLIILAGVVRFIVKYIDKKSSFNRVIPSISRIYDLMNQLVFETKANRALLMKTENNGGVPSLTSDLFSSVMYETTDYKMNLIKEDWQRRRLDGQYIKMLNNVVSSDNITKLETDDMECGILRDIYKVNKIKKSYIILIHRTNKKMVYFSLTFTDDIVDEDLVRVKLTEFRDKVSEIFKQL